MKREANACISSIFAASEPAARAKAKEEGARCIQKAEYRKT